MSICAFIGDGIAIALAASYPQCDINAGIGRNAAVISTTYVPGMHRWAVISAGAADGNSTKISPYLYVLRRKVVASNVIWVIPDNYYAAYQIKSVAAVYGDRLIFIEAGKDGIHPNSYKPLLKELKKRL